MIGEWCAVWNRERNTLAVASTEMALERNFGAYLDDSAPLLIVRHFETADDARRWIYAQADMLAVRSQRKAGLVEA